MKPLQPEPIPGKRPRHIVAKIVERLGKMPKLTPDEQAVMEGLEKLMAQQGGPEIAIKCVQAKWGIIKRVESSLKADADSRAQELARLAAELRKRIEEEGPPETWPSVYGDEKKPDPQKSLSFGD